MRMKRTLAVAAVALLVAGSLGFTAIHSLAQTAQPPAQVQTVPAPDSKPAVGADTDQAAEQVGDQNAADGTAEAPETGDGQDAAPTGTPAITADQAKATAEAHLNAGPASKVKLDAEDGKLVYSVDIGTSEVKVDAMSGAVLGVESAD